MISIFTPTYNRAYILPQLYESLKRQTCKKFEWIIVDGGSSDDTRSLVNQWISEESEFPIIHNEVDGGKHVAINCGVQLSHYAWFLIVDSDDYLTDNAVERVHEWIGTGIDKNYAAVSGTRCHSDFSIIGGNTKITSSYLDCRNNERNKYGLGGDKAEVYRTSILKKYPFPVFEGERFLTECAVWDKIAIDGFLIRWFNEPIIVCEYLDDGLTASVKRGELTLNNFEGYTYSTKIRMSAYGFVSRYRIICEYIYNARRKGLSQKGISEKLEVHLPIICLLSLVVFALSPIIHYFKTR